MALSMRLSRGGSKKRPYYKIVVADARAPRDGKFIERIGSYNPQLPKDSAERMILDAERAKHWLAAGAQPSDRVARFLDVAGVKERKVKSNPNKGEPGQKAKDRAEDRATKLAEAEEAAAAAAAAPAPEPEPEVVEEVAAEETAPAVEEAPAAEEAAPAEAVAEAAPAAEEATSEAVLSGEAPVEGVSAEAPVEGAVEPADEEAQVESASAPAEGADDAAPAAEATEEKAEG